MRMRLASPSVCAGAAALVLAALGGCGGPKNQVVPVEGKVRFADGRALPVGTRLIFQPGEGGTGGASGVTAADGSFRMVHVSGADGVEVGRYTIQLAAPKGDTGGFFKLIPKAYREGAVFHAEVKEGMPPLDLRVKRR